MLRPRWRMCTGTLRRVFFMEKMNQMIANPLKAGNAFP